MVSAARLRMDSRRQGTHPPLQTIFIVAVGGHRGPPYWVHFDCMVVSPDISSRPGVTATADMTVLPGVLGCSFDRLRTGSPCDVLFKYA